MKIKKKGKRSERYIPLSDVKEINDKYLTEMEHVKTRLNYVKDPSIITAFYEVLLSSYNAVIEMQTLEREVDYIIRLAKIKERRFNLQPFRRCWLWRLLFQPLTNRAQDIIEERAELEADILHTAEEKAIDDERKKLPQDDGVKLSRRELKRIMRDKLQAAINSADNADANEVFDDSQNAASEQENVCTDEPIVNNGQIQTRLEELPTTSARRPRPPRSCRKP